jgi:hypothetical protein
MTPPAVWAGAVMVLAGLLLGFGATVYGALRAEWRLPRPLGDVADVMVVLLLTVPLAAALLVTTWGSFRAWTVVLLALGLLVWTGLAAPLVSWAVRGAARCVAWTLRLAARPFIRLFEVAAQPVARIHLPRLGRPKTPPPN